MASILDSLGSNSIDPEKINIPTADENKAQYQEVRERSAEINQIQEQDYMDQIENQQYGNPDIANRNPNTVDRFSASSEAAGADRHIEGSAPAENAEDVHRSWLGEVQKGFMRGVGQSISSTGDLINFMGAASPDLTLLEGNIFGNSLNRWGAGLEDDNRTFTQKKLAEQNITWGSFADPRFWSTQVSEMIPLALEFMMTGAAFGAMAEKGAGFFARKASGAALRGARQTTLGAVEAMAGAGETYIDVIGTGNRIGRHLLRNVNGTGELTAFSRNFSNMAGAGISMNLMSGAMNAMELHKQMQQTNKDATARGEQPVYTEEEMANAAAGSFENNMKYMPIDVLSWAVTYGKAVEKIGARLRPNIRSSAEIIKDASASFGRATNPLLGAIVRRGAQGAVSGGKIGAHAAFEGTEEMFQETFEEWAKLKGKEAATGEKAPDYWDFFNSDENLATKVLSAAVGGLMGGATNLRSHVNANANNALNYYNRTEMLRASVDMNDRKGKEFQEFHIHNQMLDLLNDGKEDLFDKFMTGLIAEGTINEDQAKEYGKTFDKITEDFSNASSLNIAGKEALMRNTIGSNFMKDSIARDQELMAEQISQIEATIPEGPQRENAIKKIQADFNESITSKAILHAQYEQNRMNLISGQLAEPLNIEFVVSENGRERVMMPKFMTDLGFDQAMEMGGLIAGLSNEQYQNYVKKSDQEIYDDARKMNAEAKRSLKQKAKDIFESVMPKKDEPAAEESAVAETVESLTPEETARKGQLEQMIADDDAANVFNDEHAGTDQTTQPTLSPEERQAAETELTQLSEKETKASSQAAASTNNTGNSGSETSKNTDNTEKARGAGGNTQTVIDKRNVEAENEFERDAVDSETLEEDSKQTLREKEEEAIKDAEKDFLADDGTDAQPTPKKSYSIEKTDAGIYVKDADGNYLTTKTGKKRKFLNEKIAQQAIADAEVNDNNVADTDKRPGGNASKVGDFFRGVKNVFKKKSADPETVAQETRADKEKQIGQRNRMQQTLRKSVIQTVYNDRHGDSSTTNPTVEEQKNMLDAYLNSSIPKFVYGPNTIQKMIVINRNLKQKGINIDVIAANNLFNAVGVDAVGYAIAATIFIDEQAWEQPEVFMHEMGHIYYRTMKDAPETKQVLQYAYDNKALVERVKANYAEHIKYDLDFGTGEIFQVSILDALIEQGMTYAEARDLVAGGVHNLLEAYGNPPESPMEKQDIINEELFVITMEGPLSKQYDSFFQKQKEFGRQKISRSWWAHMKNQTITYEESTLDIAGMLNKGKRVPKDELFDFVMKGFEDNVRQSSLSARGFASKIAQDRATTIAESKAITKDKLSQQAAYNAEEMRKRYQKNLYDRTMDNIRKEIMKQENLTDNQKQIAIDNAIDEFEDNMLKEGVFDDYELAKAFAFRGATRILNNFTKSLNYVKRQRFLKNPNNLAADFDVSQLVDRDELVSEMYNLAFETKGNTNKFIQAIENSPIHEIALFNRYMDKLYPGEKRMMLSSMAFMMSNQQTISAIKSYVNSKGVFEMENALSETEKNKVQSHLNYLAEQASTGSESYQQFYDAYQRVKNGNQTSADYLTIIRTLSPFGVKYSELIKSNTINVRGTNGGVRFVVDNLVKSGVADGANNTVQVFKLRPFIEAVVDSNRKFTSYSVVQNAEGNFEPSKITNNHLLSQVNDMIDFLSTKKNGKMPSFQAFKKRYGHINPAEKRSLENPILKNIYDNFANKNSVPSVTQYMGLKHQQSGKNMLYKNSTDFTQTVDEFLMFAKRANSPEYQQNLGAFADSPRKFMFSAPRLSYAENFGTGSNLNIAGTKQLKTAFEIYQNLNKNVKNREGIIENFEDFKTGLSAEINREIKQWNEHGKDLAKNRTLAPYFDKTGKLTKEDVKIGNTVFISGQKKIAEFVFNQAVNGLALSEIFNPGVAVKDIVKRNKGNSSPIISTGNKNLKIEPVIINDSNVKAGTDSGMYMLREDAERIVKAGLGVFDLNNGLKLLNYSIDRDNPNFAGRAAYFKGYTTIIDENTLITEPGLKGVYELLEQRRAIYEDKHYKEYGEYTSDDLLNGEPNYLNIAVPMSAIKSDFLTPEQAKSLENMTYENLNNAGDSMQEYNDVLDKLYYSDGKFMGISGYNFGPQQIMDKVTTESTTPVQFISSVIVNGTKNGTLEMAEDIQRLVRADMRQNLDDILTELNNMDPMDYKKFILKNLDLENMDQSQRLILEESLSNLNHTAITDFVTNTLANRLKSAGNKLKTAGTIAQQKPSLHYRLKNGYSVNGSSGLQGYTDRINPDGSKGSGVLEIVLPKHMAGDVQARTYYAIDGKETLELLSRNSDLAKRYNNGNTEEKLDVIKILTQKEALKRFGRVDNENSYGFRVSDNIGTFQKDGETVGYYVKGETVMATRIPSHGPASTGVFEAVDFLAGEGNQTIVSHEFTETIGGDYDGDALFIQRQSKTTPNFNKALDKTVELWTSPEMYEQIRAKMNFEDKVKSVLKGNKKPIDNSFPMSPGYHRDAYNNTMISKRNIGTVFNMHRVANYLAAYNVNLTEPISINGKSFDKFSDIGSGEDSRNNQSAMLANIILDNAKFHYADKLGLNDQTVNQFVMLINMGVSLADASAIMNSPAVASWVKFKKNNQSPYLTNRTKSQIEKMIYTDLGIDKAMSPSLFIDTKNLGTDQQKRNVIAVMEYLEKMNEDLLKVSKIMAGHDGIESNPFILEKQIKNFNGVMDGTVKKPALNFNDGFKNNPDIKAYKENAEKILETMKQANRIYGKSIGKMMASLDEKIGYDGMTERQLERASEILKKFTNSRILGLNNIPAEEKLRMKKEVFEQLDSYYDSLADVEVDGRTGFEKSILFQRALNIGFDKGENGYVSANPRFFNESIGEEEKRAVQREFVELPQEIKDNLIVLDLMNNGLTGPLSLANVFDAGLNGDLSMFGYFQQLDKNKDISPSVMDQLENIIITAELNSPERNVPFVNTNEAYDQAEVMKFIQKNSQQIWSKMMKGEPTMFLINNDPFEFAGFDRKEIVKIQARKLKGVAKDIAYEKLIYDKITPYQKYEGNTDLAAISIADSNMMKPYKTNKSYYYDGKADHMVEANIIESQKKKPGGNASVIDYHNYNDFRPLSRQEFDRVMQFPAGMDEEQKKGIFQAYERQKEEANLLADKITPRTVVEMTDDHLKSLYAKYAAKDMYAYSIVTTPIVMEMANRAAIEQSKITGRFEDGTDVGLISSWFDNNNLPSNHPATQALVRQVTSEYKSFVKERGKYIKEINEVTDALYKEKFKLSNNRLVAFGQRVVQSLFKNRAGIYDRLYGNLVERNTIKLPGKKDRTEFKFHDEKEITRGHKEGWISDAEYNFYKAFRRITAELEPYGSGGKTRRDYIPHTAMNTFEVFATRGLLGLAVNSKGESAIDDVQLYAVIDGKRELVSFAEIKNNYNSLAASGDNKLARTTEFLQLKKRAKKLLKEGHNEDGSAITFGDMHNATLMDMSPMSRFGNSRSVKAEEMPSMDLNKALVDYVHATVFANGNGIFKGFKELVPLIDGVMAYNQKSGYKNAYNYVKEFKERFILNKDQEVFGPTGDKVVNGLVKGNMLYALGYKGFLIGKGVYAIGNIVAGKYMNIKREGGKAWVTGERRYWGTDKGFGIDALQRRRRAKNILNNLGFMEIDVYDDVNVEKKSGLDSVFTGLALLPMSATENWIQRVHFLGLLTDEEFNKFDEDGHLKEMEYFDSKRLLELEERVKRSHGKGFSPVDQSRIQNYSLGRMFMQFSRHIPANIRERFAKEDVDVYGGKHIGSLRQMYSTASAIVANRMSPEKFKEYYASLDPHEKEALKAAMRGMAMVTLLGFIEAAAPVGSDTSVTAHGAVSDANIYADPDRITFKFVPPAIRSSLAVTHGLWSGSNEEAPTVE